jgi:NADP-dependent 3-hydroxy acid dehydrogenase YdfG
MRNQANTGTVVITGASGGIGAACAEVFAELGRPLALVGRRAQALEDVAREARERGATLCHLVVGDVREDATVKQLGRLPAEFPPVDVLVNNAGLALGLEKAPAAELDDWDVMVDTNIRALLHVTRALLPGMVERNCGHIVNMGSVAGTYPYPGGNVYGATKAFVEQFSLQLRADLAGTKVRVSNIEPGMVETDFSRVRFKGDEARASAVYAGFEPLLPRDVAEAVRYVVTAPPHVNINRLEMMSVDQSFAGFSVARR